MDILEERLKQIDGAKVLDVATGRGAFIKELSKSLNSYNEITGIDCSEKNLAEARQNIEESNIHFIKMNAENLEYEDNSFDTVSISHSLHHLPDVDKSLREILRVLKSGGLLLAVEMFSDNQNKQQQNYVDMHHWWGEVDRATGVSHNPTFKRQELIDLFDKLHLTDLELKNYNDSEEIDADDVQLDNIVSQYIDRIKEQENCHKIAAKGELLLNEIKKGGIATPTMLFILGRK